MERAPGLTDRREVLARITSEGGDLCERMGPVHVRGVQRDFLDHVSRKDLVAIADAVGHLYAA